LNYPTGIAVDTFENLFFVDDPNLRIRKVSASGIITTVAGNGVFGFSGDGGLATSASFSVTLGIAAGAMLSIYATGLGAVNPPASSGQLTPTGMFFNTMAAATVTVGGINAPVSFAGLAPGMVGAYQVNFTVPSGLTLGDQTLVLSIGGSSTAPLPLAAR